MNIKCQANKQSGEPCKAVAVKDGLCALHADPHRAAEMGRRSGRSRRFGPASDHLQTQWQPPKTAQDVSQILSQGISDVLSRRVDQKTARTIGYLSNIFLKSIEVSSLEERMRKLEEQRAGEAGQ